MTPTDARIRPSSAIPRLNGLRQYFLASPHIPFGVSGDSRAHVRSVHRRIAPPHVAHFLPSNCISVPCCQSSWSFRLRRLAATFNFATLSPFPPRIVRGDALTMAYQPGDWLAQAAFARGRNETSDVVGRKKCRARRQRSDSGGQIDGRFSDADMREMRDLKLGRRRFRRWANDNMLRELAPALTAADIGSLFAPPPWGDKSVQSPLEIIMASSRDMAAWEPFRNVDMDQQAKVLQQGLHRQPVGSVGEGRQSPSMKAWCGVERNLRSALRRNYTSSFLLELEEKLDCFIEGDGQDLVLAVGSAYDRLLVHGSSQFHGLKSLTVEVPINSSGSEVETCVLIRKTEKAFSTLALNLPEFLKKIKHKECAAAA